jgi:hypothetical protein
MPGSGQKIVLTGTGKDTVLSTLMGGPGDPNPSFAISIRSDPGNSTSSANFTMGRRTAYEPFYANDSRVYYSCRIEELVINDLGGTATLYVDMSGPMDPLAQYVTAVMAKPIIIEWKKAPNDPTP